MFVKYENLQVTNSFKERGALNKLTTLSQGERVRGVVAMSAGNHAQAVAYHAARLQIPATIVMPVTTPLVKIAATEAHGARILLEGESLTQSEQRANLLAEQQGLSFVHPYDDLAVIAGQGTVGLELLQQVPELDTLVLPIGGGGVMAGVAIATKSVRPEIELIGVEAELYPSTWNALKGDRRPIGGSTLAEGIAVKDVGHLTLPVIRALVADVILVKSCI